MSNDEIVRISCEKLMKVQDCPNQDWRVAYKRYKNNLGANKERFSKAAKILNRYLPKDMGAIRIYSSITLAQKNPIEFDLRLFGQSVATLVVKEEKLILKIEKKQPIHNKEYFGIDTPKGSYPWGSEEANKIFSSLKDIDSKTSKTHSAEHKLESLVLSDLAKKSKKDGKVLTYIRPVILGGKGFFQMKTPFSASDHKMEDYPKYSMRDNGAANGGGIDILARIRHKDNSWRLAVIELKDKNNKKEPQPIVMQQALVYATFIVHLLRNKEFGNFWWNIFRNQKDEKKLNEKTQLKIDVITMMPPIPNDKKGNPIYQEGPMEPINVPNVPNVTLYPSTIYIKADLENSIINNVSGSLIDDKKK